MFGAEGARPWQGTGDRMALRSRDCGRTIGPRDPEGPEGSETNLSSVKQTFGRAQAARRRKRSRLRWSAVCLVLACAVVPSSAVGEKPSGSRCGGVVTDRTRDGVWRIAALPDTLLPRPFVSYAHAVDPLHPERAFVTDGISIVRSFDSGCSWTKVFALSPEFTGDIALTPDAYTIDSIVIPSSPTAQDRVYAVVRGTAGTQTPGDPRPHIYVSDDAGGVWEALPTMSVVGFPMRFLVAPSDPNVLYLATSSDTDATDRGMALYASADAGRTWTLRSIRAHTQDLDYIANGALGGSCLERKGCVGIEFHALAVDTQDPNSLWGGTATFGTAAIYRSIDGGATWSPVFAFDGFPGVKAIDVRHEPGAPARIAVFAVTTANGVRQSVFWSEDDGETWALRYLPWAWSDDSESVATGTTADDIVAVAAAPSSVNGVAYRNRGTRWDRLSLPRIRGQNSVLFDVVADRSAVPGFSFLAGYRKDGDHVALAGYRPEAPPASPLKPCGMIRRSSGWERIPTPIRVGTRGVGGYAVDPAQPNRIFVADAHTVARSLDGGCTWSQVLGLPVELPGSYPFNGRTTIVAAVAIPDRGAGNRSAYVALFDIDDSGSGRRPHVLATDDDGATWQVADVGLPVWGEPRHLVVSPSDPDVMYLTFQVGDDSIIQTVEGEDLGVSLVASLLYASDDGGRTWVQRHVSGTVSGRVDVPFEAPPGFVRSLVVDPVEPQTLWASSALGAVWRSRDGGTTWAVELSAEDVGVLDASTLAVYHGQGEKPSVLALDAPAGTVWTTDDPDAGVWVASHNGGFHTLWPWSTSAAFGGDRDSVVVGTFKGVFKKVARSAGDLCRERSELDASAWCARFDSIYGRFTWDPVSPDTIVLDITAATRPHPVFYGRAYEEPDLLRYRPVRELSETLRLLLAGICKECRPAHSTARLEPDDIELSMPTGSASTVPYELTIPSAPIDVFFLIDSSVSMAGANLAIQRRIVQMIAALQDSGTDVWFGVGEYRTYTCDASPETRNFPYRRDRDIAPPDPALIDAINRLEGHGQSGAALTALYQAATGAGQDILPPGASRSDIAAGGQATFRPGSLRVIVHAADRYFNAPGRDPGTQPDGCTYPSWPGPTFERTVRALEAKAIHQIGLIGFDESEVPPLGQFQGEPASGYADLRRVAAETGTLAPRGGVDCDGDGRPELKAGEPLVCRVPGGLREDNGERMAASVVRAIKALPFPASVRFSEETQSGVVSEIAPGSYTGVDLNGRKRLGLNVTYRCGLAPGVYPVSLTAAVSNGLTASATARVRCEAPPAATLLPGPGLGLAPVPAPQPPLEVPGAQPGQEPQPQGQPGTHGALAAEEQAQPQTALVLVTQAIQEQQTELAFSSRRVRDPYGAARVPLGVAAAVLTAAFGWLSAARARAQLARRRSR